MKYIVSILLIVLSNYSYAEADDLIFFGTDKSHSYTIKRASKQLSSEYGFKVNSIYIVVASSKKSEQYQKQLDYLKTLDAEQMSLIYIVALVDKPDTHGYHTSTDIAKQILGNDNFKMQIFSPSGKLLSEFGNVLSDKEIKNLVTEYNKQIVSN